jgi:hypothetical protein
VCVHLGVPLITSVWISRVLWNSVRRLCRCRWPRNQIFYSRSFNRPKMADDQTPKVSNTCIRKRGIITFWVLTYSKYKQLLMRPYLWKTKHKNVEGCLKLQLFFISGKMMMPLKVWRSKSSWTFLLILFDQLFCLTTLLSVEMVWILLFYWHKC